MLVPHTALFEVDACCGGSSDVLGDSSRTIHEGAGSGDHGDCACDTGQIQAHGQSHTGGRQRKTQIDRPSTEMAEVFGEWTDGPATEMEELFEKWRH